MSVEVKQQIEELNKTWNSMKEYIDRGAEEQKNLGQRLGDTEEVLTKHNEALDRIEKTLNEIKAPPVRREAKDPLSDVKYNGSDLEAFKKFTRHGYSSLNPEEQKVMTVADSTTGGFLAPTEMLNEFIKGVVEYSPARGLVRVRNTNLRAVKVPRRTQTGSATWVGEIETRTSTQEPKIGMIEIPTHELYARTVVSVQDLEDTAFDLQGFIREEAVEQFAVAESAAVVNGDGNVKPFGILQNTEIEQKNTGAAGALTADGLIDFVYSLKSFYVPQSRIGLNRLTIAEVRKLKETTDGNYLWSPGLTEKDSPRIVGIPYTELPEMPTVAPNALVMAYGDWRRAYLLVDRVAMQIVRDDITLADQGQVKFLMRKRLGGQVILPEAMKLLKVAA